MKRTQIYITAEQDAQLAMRAADRGLSKAAVIREILDAALDTDAAEQEARAAILSTAGILDDAPGWEEWQRDVRGRDADRRLTDLRL